MSPEEVLDIRAWYAGGDWTYQTLADEFGVCKHTISNIIRRKSWKHLPGPAYTGRAGRLTEIEVLFIDCWLRAGYEMKVIAKRFEVPTYVVHRIKKGRAWVSVTGR